jgi:streptomycin 6-kinase
MNVRIPPAFARTQREVYGERGEAWLQRLPAIVAALEERWDFEMMPPFSNLSYNYVAPVRRTSGEPAVLKLGVPSPETASEMHALALYDGDGIARLYQHDASLSAMLIEQVAPGRMLAELDDDDEATRIIGTLMRRLWRPLPAGHPLQRVADWTAGLGRLRVMLDGGTVPFPGEIVARAEQTFADLLASAGAPMLLHGDLHHYNVLSAERAPWLVIDPKGLAGDPGFDVGAMLHNPSRTLRAVSELGGLFARRLSILAEVLAIPRDRLAAWAFAQAVLSAWWTYEDHGHVGHEALHHAELFAVLM